MAALGVGNAACGAWPATPTQLSFPVGVTTMNVFLSYRRDDSQYIADRIYDWLIRERDRRNVFKDVDSIPLGQDFRQVIHDAVGQCDVLLVVIGPGETKGDIALY